MYLSAKLCDFSQWSEYRYRTSGKLRIIQALSFASKYALTTVSDFTPHLHISFSPYILLSSLYLETPSRNSISHYTFFISLLHLSHTQAITKCHCLNWLVILWAIRVSAVLTRTFAGWRMEFKLGGKKSQNKEELFSR